VVSFATMSEAVLKKCILQAGIPRGDVSRNIESWRHNSQLPIIPFERSRRAADAAREVKVGLVACGLR
jgi:hypothetical protein